MILLSQIYSRQGVWAAFFACGLRQPLAQSKLEQVLTMNHTCAECFMAQRKTQQSGSCSDSEQGSRQQPHML